MSLSLQTNNTFRAARSNVSEHNMDWNTILLIALVVVMLICCGGMMRMTSRRK
jgi:hypothetical protein